MRLANLLTDAADHLDASRRAQLEDAIAAMEAALASPADTERRAAG
nr:hypothetical protein [Lysobacter enzymogenes]